MKKLFLNCLQRPLYEEGIVRPSCRPFCFWRFMYYVTSRHINKCRQQNTGGPVTQTHIKNHDRWLMMYWINEKRKQENRKEARRKKDKRRKGNTRERKRTEQKAICLVMLSVYWIQKPLSVCFSAKIIDFWLYFNNSMALD